jgi:hypothetical protein
MELYLHFPYVFIVWYLNKHRIHLHGIVFKHRGFTPLYFIYDGGRNRRLKKTA